MNRTVVALLLPVVCSISARDAAAQHGPPDLFAASRQARANGRFGMLLRQFRSDEPALNDHHEAGSKPAIANYRGACDIPAGFWVWQRPFWFVFRDGPGTWPARRPFGPEAACGPPDASEPDTEGMAWATKDLDAKDEWLLLEYAAPLRGTSLEVHETHNPGAIAAVAILTPQGDELEMWRNRDVKSTAEAQRILHIDLPLGFEFERVKLYLASEAVAGRNEIDAVGLRDDKGEIHWACRATASSTLAPGPEVVSSVPAEVPRDPLLPWQRLRVETLDEQSAILRVNLSGGPRSIYFEGGCRMVPVPQFGAIVADSLRH